MSVRKTIMAAAMVFIIAGAVPAKASADWLFTPFVGFNFNGSANTTETGQTFNDEFKRKADFGASLAWMGAGIFGVEFDFGYSPNFFKETTGDVNLGFSDSNVTTFMGNIVVGAPIGGTSGKGIRPYASGGVGLIRARIDDVDDFFDTTSNDWGLNAGAGVHMFFSDKVGVRGDVRYFRSLKDDDTGNGVDFSLGSFDYWRGSVGVSFRF